MSHYKILQGADKTDRYFTPPTFLESVHRQWPEGIDLDPCWDPGCVVSATTRYDIRKDQDGLALPWIGKVFCNPPYSEPAPWLAKAARHGETDGGECIVLVNATVGNRPWKNHVYPYALILFLLGRVKFRRFDRDKSSTVFLDSAVLYYGKDRQRFIDVWGSKGTIVQAINPIKPSPTIFDLMPYHQP